MSEYKNYCVNITLKSTLITPFQADTLFGHICWAIKYLRWNGNGGCRKLEEFMKCYDNSKPPLLISDGFQKGYLPKPIIKPITQEELKDILEEMGEMDIIKNSYMIKTIKKMKFIPKEIFEELSNQITPKVLFKRLLERFEEVIKEKSRKEVVYHNTVNRVTNTVTFGLYQQEEIFFDSPFNEFEIYIKTNCFSKQELEKIFEFIAESGYGRDKSTGKGHFCFKIIENGKIKEADSPNAFMTLSSYIPDSKAPTNGYYDILLKYGKLGGDFAKSDPFKVPLIMFRSGSTFYDEKYSKDKSYGSLLKKVHRKNPDIRHYAYAFPVGINIKEE